MFGGRKTTHHRGAEYAERMACQESLRTLRSPRLCGAIAVLTREDESGESTGRGMISAGAFMMGSDQGQENEQPIHRVWLDDFAYRQISGDEPGLLGFSRTNRASRRRLFGPTRNSLLRSSP